MTVQTKLFSDLAKLREKKIALKKNYLKEEAELAQACAAIEAEIATYESLSDKGLYSTFPEHIPFTITGKLNPYYGETFKQYLVKFQELLLEAVNDFSPKATILRNNLEIQDNAYGGDLRQYLAVVQKNMATNYHPSLFSIKVDRDISFKDLEQLLSIVTALLEENKQDELFTVTTAFNDRTMKREYTLQSSPLLSDFFVIGKASFPYMTAESSL